MSKKLKLILLLLCIFLSSACLGVGISIIPEIDNKPTVERPSEALDETTESVNNTTISVNAQFRYSTSSTPTHMRADSYLRDCPQGGSRNGWWYSSSATCKLDTNKNGSFYSTGNYATTKLLYSSASQCPSCGYNYGFTIHTYNITLSAHVSVNEYGTYSFDAYDSQGNDQYIGNLIEHYYKGTLSLNKNGGTGGTDAVSIQSNSLLSITPPTRSGFKFKGYYTALNSGTQMFNASGSPAYQPIAKRTFLDRWIWRTGLVRFFPKSRLFININLNIKKQGVALLCL